MMKTLILFYTCSGNTQIIAKRTADILKEEGWEVSLENLRSYSQSYDSAKLDLIVLGVPVFYWEIPSAALRMIRELPRYEGVTGFVFTTFGKCVCNSVPYNLATELEKKGVRITGGAQIVMPHSARIGPKTRIGDNEISFGKGEPSEEVMSQYKSAIQKIAKRIKNGRFGEISTDELKKLHTRNAAASFINIFMTKQMKITVMPAVQHDVRKCTQCTICISDCDPGAITLNGIKIKINKKLCVKCYKCIEKCPHKALTTAWNRLEFWVRFIHCFAKNTETTIISLNDRVV
ncbi:MAG: EFR1 family ferrodoxin [Dehalococcoidales bacterium]|nr:MAG: EFR1 family ferrodoxin [Dehalococcoidales bacterium]